MLTCCRQRGWAGARSWRRSRRGRSGGRHSGRGGGRRGVRGDSVSSAVTGSLWAVRRSRFKAKMQSFLYSTHSRNAKSGRGSTASTGTRACCRAVGNAAALANRRRAATAATREAATAPCFHSTYNITCTSFSPVPAPTPSFNPRLTSRIRPSSSTNPFSTPTFSTSSSTALLKSFRASLIATGGKAANCRTGSRRRERGGGGAGSVGVGVGGGEGREEGKDFMVRWRRVEELGSERESRGGESSGYRRRVDS